MLSDDFRRKHWRVVCGWKAVGGGERLVASGKGRKKTEARMRQSGRWQKVQNSNGDRQVWPGGRRKGE
jgi:hypothetical protein